MLHRFNVWATTPQPPLLPLSAMAGWVALFMAVAGFIPLWGGYFLAVSALLLPLTAGPSRWLGLGIALLNLFNLMFFSKIYQMAAISGMHQGRYEMVVVYAGLMVAQLLGLLGLFLLQRRMRQLGIWP
ncbi:hypothetical protein Mmc1_1005 [Magnetococcus marinus MC-1]|uniref:Uncharacterized protein n=1 Tax=Magnetococcus marinus (strain ATCC BAA-1437 / JCM 17883 / MC-1) TaxID=156889 RepID=A0L6D0_MAGMM|nr:hypothetical protein [Magnetococcus marinus]ABK43523.1 hypothetical protein Mmc1_1005 [Magnetococcus marinus MC-1]